MNEKNRIKRRCWLMALGAAALMAAAGAVMLPEKASAPDTQTSAAQEKLREGGEIRQTLTYTRCEHTVTRRFTAPVELYGKGLDEISALYPDWRITEFSPVLVRMEKQPELFCPDHQVLMADGAGFLCVYENKYGDSMALVRETEIPLQNLPAAAQEALENGLGFSTAEELEAWLESVES